MNSGIVSVVIIILLTSVIIYILKNENEIRKKYNELKNKIIIKIFKVILIIFVSLIVFWDCYNSIKISINNVKSYKNKNNTSSIFEEFDYKLKEEKQIYKELIEKDYGSVQKEPYIPEGFNYIEGDINSGYVIQDKNGNEYVWVPCTNINDENIVKLQKKDFYVETGIRYFDCLNVDCKEFIESALKYGGFYISRFELGKEGENIVSKFGVPVLSYVSRYEISELVEKMYSDINCKLINGYAYDTTLEWIEKNNKIDVGKYCFNKGEDILSGRVKYNNIYDFIDNVMEITTEEFYDSIIYRGFDYGKDIELDSRYNISEERVSSYNEQLRLLAFRTVIYK